nr:porin [Pseudaminobacter sp.]
EEGAGAGHALDSYTPHVVGGASLTQGWGGVSGAIGYDSVIEEWAGKVRLDVKPTPVLAAFVMVGLSTTDTGSYYATWDGDWAVWGGASLAVTDKATVNVQVSYDDSEAFAAVANVGYKLVQGLMITPEIGYYDSDLDAGDDGSIGGFVRIQRGL